VPNFGSVLTNAVDIKGITVYLRKSCSNLALKKVVKLIPGDNVMKYMEQNLLTFCKQDHFVILSNNFLHALKETRLKKSE